MDPVMNEEQSQFIADAREMVEKLDRDLEQLRAVRAHGPKRRELAARIFRRVHTLKGSAGVLGLPSVSLVAHEFEGVLDGVRLGRIEISDDVLDAFEDASGAIARALAAGPSEPGEPGIEPVGERLHALAAPSRKQGTIASGLRSALPTEIARALSEYDLQHAREAIGEGAKLFIVSAGFSLESFDLQFRELSKLLGQSGEIIATVPGEVGNPEEINFGLLYAAELVSNETLRLASALGRIELDELKIEPSAAGEKLVPDPLFLSAPSALPIVRVAVRVELDELDQLVSDTSELFRETTNALESLSGPANKPAVDIAGARLRRRCVQLEERLIKLRLVPCAEVFERTATRAGQTVARQLGKQVEFVARGRRGKLPAAHLASRQAHRHRQVLSGTNPVHRTRALEDVYGVIRPLVSNVYLHRRPPRSAGTDAPPLECDDGAVVPDPGGDLRDSPACRVHSLEDQILRRITNDQVQHATDNADLVNRPATDEDARCQCAERRTDRGVAHVRARHHTSG